MRRSDAARHGRLSVRAAALVRVRRGRRSPWPCRILRLSDSRGGGGGTMAEGCDVPPPDCAARRTRPGRCAVTPRRSVGTPWPGHVGAHARPGVYAALAADARASTCVRRRRPARWSSRAWRRAGAWWRWRRRRRQCWSRALPGPSCEAAWSARRRSSSTTRTASTEPWIQAGSGRRAIPLGAPGGRGRGRGRHARGASVRRALRRLARAGRPGRRGRRPGRSHAAGRRRDRPQ